MKALGLGVMIILFVISVALLLLTMSRVKEAKKFKKVTVIYLIVAALCFGITALTGFVCLKDGLVSFYYIIQVFFLIIGVLHVYLLYRILPWASKNKFLWEFLFSVAIGGFGAIFFLLVYNFLLNEHSLQYILLTAITWFFIPFFFMQAFNRYLEIPACIYRKWYYPVGKDIADPLDSELVSLLVVSFVFHKKMNDPEITTFRAKAPAHMVFGRLFYYFLNDYNERHREGPIEYLDQDHHPHGWVFHHKPNWLGMKRYIDPDLIITDNHIRENSVIICQRVKES